MGDRANIVIHQEQPEPPVVIYSHWHGSELPDYLAAALDTPMARARVGDPASCGRIIFCQVLKAAGAGADEETGWGLSTGICDNEHPMIHVDAMTGNVHIGGTDLERPADEAWTDMDTFIATQRAVATS